MRRRRRSLLYIVYLRSPLWRLRRRIWIVRAGGRCQRCGSRRRLTIHHRTYKRLGHERRADVAVLCWDCHRRHHGQHRNSLTPGLLAWIGRHAWAERRGTLRLGRGSSRSLAFLTLIALPTLVLAATLVVER